MSDCARGVSATMALGGEVSLLDCDGLIIALSLDNFFELTEELFLLGRIVNCCEGRTANWRVLLLVSHHSNSTRGSVKTPSVVGTSAYVSVRRPA